MWLWWAVMAGCGRDGEAVVGDPTEITPTEALGPELVLHADAGVRDLRAESSPEASIRWERVRDGLVVDGPVVAASEVYPGDVWQVVATSPDGETPAELTVAAPPGGNILLIVVDDIGVDHIGTYGMGTEIPPTPRIDALASEGVQFQRAYASPNCSPTRGELMSGRHARRTGLGWIVDTGLRDGQLPIEAVTVPEALWDARGEVWSNAALGKWHLAGPQVDHFLTHPNRSGFDHFAGTWGNAIYRAGYGYLRWMKNVDGVRTETEGYLTTAVVDDALEQIALLPEPWFLYVAFHAAHTPLVEPPPELYTMALPDEPTENDLFSATVEALDTELGRLLDEMPPELRANTTIILMGDNGTPGHAVDPPLDPLRAKSTPFEQGVRVPLIVAGPHVAPGTIQDSLVHAVDVFTLIAEIAGVPLAGTDQALSLATDGTVLDGQAMLPLLADPQARGREVVYAEGFSANGEGPYTTDMRGVRDERWSLIRKGEQEYFFDLGLTPTLWEGEDLLQGELTDESEEAWTRLTATLDGIEAELVYEGR
jgi:arylsulfatase A-like enzyme